MARHFTVDEANELIPTLTPVLEDMQGLRRQMLEAAREIAEFEARISRNGHGDAEVLKPNKTFARLRSELEQRLMYLQGIGVHVKDIDEGIIDFPSRMFDREVYLCWRLGEPAVGHWHDIDSGFGGRQPL